MTVALVSPLPVAWFMDLWAWINEAPAANLDDYGPSDFAAFAAELLRRQKQGEKSWGVLADGARVGAIGYAPLTPRLGSLHGICFTEAACGTGAARDALYQVLDALFDSGVEKVSASYFVDNARVDRFLRRVGFVEEGLLVDQTVRKGVRLSMRQVALFRPHAGGD